MAAEDITVQQDTGSGPGQSLPQGAASEVNANLPTETVSGPGEALAAPAEDQAGADAGLPEPAQPSDYEPVFQPENDDEDFLTGPTTRPDEPVTTGAFGGGRTALPPDAPTWMPVFVEAAQLPDAPPQLKALVRILTSNLET